MSHDGSGRLGAALKLQIVVECHLRLSHETGPILELEHEQAGAKSSGPERNSRTTATITTTGTQETPVMGQL